MITSFEEGEFFIYHGRYYKSGTQVKLSDNFILNSKDWIVSNEARFSIRNFKQNCYIFQPINIDHSKIKGQYGYYGTFRIPFDMIDSAIDAIILPYEVDPSNIVTLKPKKDWEVPGIMLLWVLYIITLIASFIFKEFYVAWGVATYIFFKIRKKMLKP